MLSPSSGEVPSLREMACYALKSYLMRYLPVMQPMVLAYVKTSVLSALGDADAAVNRAVSTLISYLITLIKVDAWPEAVRTVATVLSGDRNHPAFVPALTTVHKLCEEDADDLLHAATQPLASLLPLLIALVADASVPPPVAELALRCMAELVHGETALLEQQFDAFLAALFSRAHDPAPALRKAVCFCIVRVAEYRPDKLEPAMPDVANYMLECTAQRDDTALALEATEFWLVLGELEQFEEALASVYPQLIPAFLSAMAYSEEELVEMGATGEDEDDAHLPDAEADLRPRHYRGKSEAEGGHDGTPATATAADEDDEDDDDDDDDEDDAQGAWTLRKCSAAALDMLANVFGTEILQYLLPELEGRLGSPTWLLRESAILALGAVADGCVGGISNHLPQLVPYLLNIISTDRPLVRSIACWALGRYSNWLLSNPAGQPYLDPFVLALVAGISARTKRVQEASLSSLATLEEAAGPRITPYLPQILPALASGLQTYQKKNMLVLYDCIGTLAESLGPGGLAEPRLAAVLVAPLMARFDAIGDLDTDLLPLFEALGAVAAATGLAFAPLAKKVVERALRVVSSCYTATDAYSKNPVGEEPVPDFYIVSLDLIGGVVTGLGSSSESLVAMYVDQLLASLRMLLDHRLPAVKQSAFGLFGDLTVNSFLHVKSFSHELLSKAIPLILMYNESTWMRLCNNAVWMCAEMTSRLGPEMAPMAPALWERVLPLLTGAYEQTAPALVAQNCALCAGRLGHVAPDLVARDLPRFASAWATNMCQVVEGAEKEASYLGFLEIVRRNPRGMIPNNGLPLFFGALLHYRTVVPATEEAFYGILGAFKEMLGEEGFQGIVAHLQPEAQQMFHERFRV
ncbi:armadillo-type protein [Blastocladiella britannica]|nr:armadillo-type protein [Blastocladiella britannica]